MVFFFVTQMTHLVLVGRISRFGFGGAVRLTTLLRSASSFAARSDLRKCLLVSRLGLVAALSLMFAEEAAGTRGGGVFSSTMGLWDEPAPARGNV